MFINQYLSIYFLETNHSHFPKHVLENFRSHEYILLNCIVFFISIYLLHNILQNKNLPSEHMYRSRRVITSTRDDRSFSLILSCFRPPDSLINITLKRELSVMDIFWRNRSIINYRSDIFPVFWAQSLAELIDQTKSHLSSNVFEIKKWRVENHLQNYPFL